jgi:hypothetical protein
MESVGAFRIYFVCSCGYLVVYPAFDSFVMSYGINTENRSLYSFVFWARI